MKNNKIEQVKQLIDGKLSDKESNKLIAEIKKSEELKLEFALLTKIKEASRQRLKEKLKERIEQTAINTETAATIALANIRQAAFANDKGNCKPEDLPIDEETIDEFLEGDED